MRLSSEHSLLGTELFCIRNKISAGPLLGELAALIWLDHVLFSGIKHFCLAYIFGLCGHFVKNLDPISFFLIIDFIELFISNAHSKALYFLLKAGFLRSFQFGNWQCHFITYLDRSSYFNFDPSSSSETITNLSEKALGCVRLRNILGTY